MKEIILEMVIRLTGYEELRNNQNINLIEEDILDSLAFLQLINELNNEFDIEIQPTQVSSDTWNNIDNIVKMVELYMNK